MMAENWFEEEGYVQNGEVKLHYVAAGPVGGEPVLLLHGFPQSSYLWRRHLMALAARGYRVVAPDLRGYNLSDRPTAPEAYRMQQLVGDIGAFYQAFGWQSANLVAHDWGGAVSWLFATFYPQQVRRFVAIDIPHPTAFRAALQRPAQMRDSWYIWLFQFAGVAERVIGRNPAEFFDYIMFNQPRAGTFTRADWQEYLRMLAQPGQLEAAFNYYRVNTGPANVYSETMTDFPPLKLPVLLLYGSRDFAFIPQAWEDTAEFCQGYFKKVGLEGFGHWVLEEAPQETLDLIVEHLQTPLS
jgi:pimeloyl-ACP methyl ester carboxylesterase